MISRGASMSQFSATEATVGVQLYKTIEALKV